MITYSDIYTYCVPSTTTLTPPDQEKLRGIIINAPLMGRKDAPNGAEKRKKTEL